MRKATTSNGQKFFLKFAALSLLLVAAAPAWAQHEHGHPPPSQPAQPQAPPQQAQPPSQARRVDVELPAGLPPLPRLGRSQPERGMTLEQLQQIALEHNPTLRQAQAQIRAAAGRQVQAGLWPNPIVGYSGEEIRGGSNRGGQHGFFVEQNILLGGKLGAARRVARDEQNLAEIEAEEQRYRVLNAVRLTFYQVLAAQELLQTQREFARFTAESLKTSQQLVNIGQADPTEVLQEEIESYHAELAVVRAENQLRRAWAALSSLVGRPELPMTGVNGRLDGDLPQLDAEAVMQKLVKESPATRIAGQSVARAESLLGVAQRDVIPNLQLRGGLQQNREIPHGAVSPVGLQGFVEVGLQLPLFNRNQGAIAAARADIERAREEERRVELILRERASVVASSYLNARALVERYRDHVMPRAQQSYELMLAQWGQMGASYPTLLRTQRTVFNLHRDYIAALEELWTSAVTLEGFLLTDGLEAPARPGEMDLPVREINVPVTRGVGAERD